MRGILDGVQMTAGQSILLGVICGPLLLIGLAQVCQLLFG